MRTNNILKLASIFLKKAEDDLLEDFSFEDISPETDTIDEDSFSEVEGNISQETSEHGDTGELLDVLRDKIMENMINRKYWSKPVDLQDRLEGVSSIESVIPAIKESLTPEGLDVLSRLWEEAKNIVAARHFGKERTQDSIVRELKGNPLGDKETHKRLEKNPEIDEEQIDVLNWAKRHPSANPRDIMDEIEVSNVPNPGTSSIMSKLKKEERKERKQLSQEQLEGQRDRALRDHGRAQKAKQREQAEMQRNLQRERQTRRGNR